uniref:Eif7 n=1 Tax=Arundo donax TaxID=35708 RepID=A0A0A9EYV0_ARUDO
MIRFSVQVS